MSEAAPIIAIRNLTVKRSNTVRSQLEDISLSLNAGETLTLLGESGCGKEEIIRVLTGVTRRSEQISGTVQFRGGASQEIRSRTTGDLRVAFLPGPLAQVFSARATVLSQLLSILARKLNAPRASVRAELVLALERLPGAPKLEALDTTPLLAAPAALAFGLLATAMAQNPELLIAEDPTAGLSPAQAGAFLRVLQAEQKRLGFAFLLVSAGSDTARRLGGNVIVLRNGRVVEEGPVERLATAQAHAYTQTLFRSNPGSSKEPPALRSGLRGEPVLQVYAVQTVGSVKRDARSRDSLNFELRRGASLALLGEQGSGRRALLRALLGLDPVAAGRIVFDAVDIGVLSTAMMLRLRRRVAFITGDDEALDPRMTLFDTVAEPLRAHLRLARDGVVRNRDAALKRVGLAALDGNRPVASLSPFDKRRLQVARAIISAPLLTIVDEPLRGLDAYAQTVMRDLLRSLRQKEGPALLLITSDFSLAQAFAEDALVFKDGQIVERGAIAELLRAPKDAQTRRMIDAVAAAPQQSLSPAPSGG